MKFSAKQAIFALSVATNPGVNPALWAWRYKIIGTLQGWTFDEMKKEMLKAQGACNFFQRN